MEATTQTTRQTTPIEKKVLNYLNELRDSGQTNMLGARPYVIRKFPVSSDEAQRLLQLWMANFNDEGNYDTVKA